MLVILDFGSQTTHLIKRRLIQLGVKVELADPSTFDPGRYKKLKGLILSGGPASVYNANSPDINFDLATLDIPILGICYGWQLTAHSLKGKVLQGNKEYGPTKVKLNKQSPLFKNIKSRELKVWMSHGDEVAQLPVGFDYHASSSNIKAAGVGDFERKIFGVQFHPEVEHTQEGKKDTA